MLAPNYAVKMNIRVMLKTCDRLGLVPALYANVFSSIFNDWQSLIITADRWISWGKGVNQIEMFLIILQALQIQVSFSDWILTIFGSHANKKQGK